MTDQAATQFVPAAPHVVRSILLQPRKIPAWNPAFLSLTGPESAATGVEYPITVRGGLRGTFQYSGITERRIGWTWRVPGLHEVGEWSLTPQDGGALVHHKLAHQGPLALMLRSAFEGVVYLRLGRLTERALIAPADRAIPNQRS